MLNTFPTYTNIKKGELVTPPKWLFGVLAHLIQPFPVIPLRLLLFLEVMPPSPRIRAVGLF